MSDGDRLVRVLLEDPSLGDGLAPEELAAAQRDAVAVSRTLPRGTLALPGAEGDFGLLLLEGFVGRETAMSGRRSLELIGPGDVGRPWDVDDDDGAPVRAVTTWTVLQPARVVLLDERFARVAGQWPSVMGTLLSRALHRSRWLSLVAAASAIPRLQDRLLVLLWVIAGRWGRVTPRGITVPVRLTQAQLAAVAGARRPSVSTAMTALAAKGLVTRDNGGWCLSHAALAQLEEISSQGDEAWRTAAAVTSRVAPAVIPAVAALTLG
jgi:CRP/FNR family cyclic AMP-dependent transcriptional regulator